MVSPSIPLYCNARMSPTIQQRTLRWIMFCIVALAAFLVALVGQPPAHSTGRTAQHSGLSGVSHSDPLGPNG